MSLSDLAELPAGVLEHVLSSDLRAQDLQSLLSVSANHPSHSQLHSAVHIVSHQLLLRCAHGRHLISTRQPHESFLDLLLYLHSLDINTNTYMPRTTIYSCGRNSFGQGARFGDDANILQPTLRPGGVGEAFKYHAPLHQSPPMSLRAGEDFSFALTAAGGLFVAGGNTHGQLGLGDRLKRPTWTLCVSLLRTRIVQIACGAAHALALDANGRLFATGANCHGQLGVHDMRNRELFTVVPEISGVHNLGRRICMVAAGDSHSVVLLDNGEVFAAGDAAQGQLGPGYTDSGRSEFAKLLCFGHKVVRIAAGANTTMLLTANNMVLVSGKRPGGLSVIGGLGTSLVTHISVGRGFAVARTLEEEVAISVHMKRFLVAEGLAEIKAECISAGTAHYAVVTTDGQVLAAGSNAFGQVAAGDMGLYIAGGEGAREVRSYKVPLTKVEIPQGWMARYVAAGAHHSLYILQRCEETQTENSAAYGG